MEQWKIEEAISPLLQYSTPPGSRMRALLLVLDSVGIGHAPDAEKYGDEGANTLGHILEQLPDLALRNLSRLGLTEIAGRAHASTQPYLASYGKMQERSAGKDTTTGHWELAGAIVDVPFSVFATFPEPLVREIEKQADVKFIGNYARSGTTILEELGSEHVRTGHPILYTSADSVLQIAAHEDVIPIERLYKVCEIARRCSDEYRIGRVIARPFDGPAGNFKRTTRRHDFSIKPPRTVLNAIQETGMDVTGVGKISDIFAGEGVTASHPTSSNAEGMKKIEELWAEASRGLIFANLVDFDMLHGHRRDVAGYARTLAAFDQWLGGFLPSVSPEDLVIITADHGNDPTFAGTDHTREQVPLFVMHHHESRNLGTRSTYADVAASLNEFFQLSEPWPVGISFLDTVPA
jgi:phosphopentomutase